jgi:hypothetical protein
MVSLILEIVETQVRMIRRNYELLDSIRSRSDLTLKQKEELDEWEENYANHLLASEPERMEKYLSHLDLDDPVVSKQSLNLGSVHELIHGVGLQNIVKKEPQNRREIDADSVNKMHEPQGAVLQNVQCSKLNYYAIQHDINVRLSKILVTNKDIIAGCLNEIHSFLDDLWRLLSRRNSEPRNVHQSAIKLIEKLSKVKENDVSELVDWLKNKFEVEPVSNSNEKGDLGDKLTLSKQVLEIEITEPQEPTQDKTISQDSQWDVVSCLSNLMQEHSLSADLATEVNKLLFILGQPFTTENAEYMLEILNQIRDQFPESSEVDNLSFVVQRYIEEEQQRLVNQL